MKIGVIFLREMSLFWGKTWQILLLYKQAEERGQAELRLNTLERRLILFLPIYLSGFRGTLSISFKISFCGETEKPVHIHLIWIYMYISICRCSDIFYIVLQWFQNTLTLSNCFFSRKSVHWNQKKKMNNNKKLFYVHSVLHPLVVLSLEVSLFPFGEIFHMNVTAISRNSGHTFVIVIVSP